MVSRNTPSFYSSVVCPNILAYSLLFYSEKQGNVIYTHTLFSMT